MKIITIIVTLLLVVVGYSSNCMAVNNMTPVSTENLGLQLAQQILNRPANEGRVGNMHFVLRNAAGIERKRSALLIHSEQHEKVKIGIFFTSPAALQNTVFLSHDNKLEEDENWLYLPVTKRVRRIPSTNRSDYFMGTDLSYGDIKDDFKFPIEDWDFRIGELSADIPANHAILLGVAKDEAKKTELGYSSFYALIDLNSYLPVLLRYTDTDGVPLKEVSVHEQALVGGAWTAMQFTIKQLQLAHQTDIVLHDMRYVPNLPEALLTADEISYGVPVL